MTRKTLHPLQGIFFAILGFGLFSTHDAIIKSFHGGLSVPQIMFFSTIFAFPWVSVMVMADGRREHFRPNHPFMLVLRTIFGMLTGAGVFYAFMTLPLAEVYGLLFMTPLLITLLAVPFLGERLGIARLSAVALGFIGVIVMLPFHIDQISLGHLSAIGAAFSAAINAIITRKIGKDEREVVMIMLPMAISLIILAILLPANYQAPSIVQLYKLILTGTLGFFGQLMIVFAYKKSDAAIVSPMQYSQLLWAVFYGLLFFNESISSRTMLGAAIIIASGLIILYRESKGGSHSRTHPVTNSRNYRPDTVRGWFSRGKKG